MNILALGLVDVPVGLHGSREGVNNGNGTSVLDGS